jgi:DNA repair protein RecN (Recombination protein N)
LKTIGAKLVDIHSQHQNLLLEDDSFQLKVIDSFAQNQKLLDEYYENYKDFRKLKTQYNNLSDTAHKSQSDLDYLQFQFEQLENANLEEGEQEILEDELEKLNHTEEIKKNLSSAYQLINDEQISVVDNLKQVKDYIQAIVSFFPQTENIYQRLDSSYIEIQDIANEIDVLSENVDYDPKRIEFIRDRLDTIYSLQQKHNVDKLNELIEIKENLEIEINKIDSFDFELDKLKKHLQIVKENLEQKAIKVSESRVNVFNNMENQIIKSLINLGINNAAFKIAHLVSDNFSAKGKDIIDFQFSANKNSDLQSLSKVASGGELSRLMLSLKAIIAENDDLPTIILDEIDTGTSGEIADKMGTIMKGMSNKMQVIAITHLAQIAGKGDSHYLVYKKDNETSTFINIKFLNKDERIRALAKMLSGEILTDAAMQNAKVLLEQ